MKKNFIEQKISKKHSIKKNEAEVVINKIFKVIRKEVLKNNFAEIESFGYFTVERNESRVKIDEEKKKRTIFPPEDKIIFKPTAEVLQKINSND